MFCTNLSREFHKWKAPLGIALSPLAFCMIRLLIFERWIWEMGLSPWETILSLTLKRSPDIRLKYCIGQINFFALTYILVTCSKQSHSTPWEWHAICGPKCVFHLSFFTLTSFHCISFCGQLPVMSLENTVEERKVIEHGLKDFIFLITISIPSISDVGITQ